MKLICWCVSLCSLALFPACQNNSSSSADQQTSAAALPSDSVVQIAKDAYIFAYPLMMIEYTKRALTNVESVSPKGFAPINQLAHKRSFPDHTFTEVVKPNCDTYYSLAFFDLKAEPMVLQVPATNRFYLLPMLDAWTNVFASPGTRTTGTKAQTFLLAGPGWKGTIPANMQLLQAPTQLVWMIGRIQVNSKADGEKVVIPLQDQFAVVPLSAYGKPYQAPKGQVNPAYLKMVPGDVVGKLDIETYLNEAAQLMVDNPPAAADSQMLRRMASIGLEPGKPFSMAAFDKVTKVKLKALPSLILKGIETASNNGDPKQTVNGWKYMTEKMAEFGTDYTLRAGVAFGGLGANSAKDAVYPGTESDSQGRPLHSDHAYTVHFEKKDLPPVHAFWSMTIYNQRDFLAENPINRFAIGDRDRLKYNADGSLDIYIQKTSPGKDKEANWLPTPQSGLFKITMRLYWPKDEVLQRSWLPPVVTRLDR